MPDRYWPTLGSEVLLPSIVSANPSRRWPCSSNCAAASASAASEVGSSSIDRKSTRLNSSHLVISYAVFCLKKKQYTHTNHINPNRLPTHTFLHAATQPLAEVHT